MSKIVSVKAREILDSRGVPTVEVETALDSGVIGRASIPSGASTGAYEAIELRDGDPKRYNGKGTLKAVNNINTEIQSLIVGKNCHDQSELDESLIKLDGTNNKSRLGANALLGASLSIAKAAAHDNKLSLFKNLSGGMAKLLPVPMLNIINGGKHADNSIDLQEFMIMPVSASSIREACKMGAETYHALKLELSKLGHITSVGDEGGFAPNLRSTKEALDLLSMSIDRAGLKVGQDIFFALDCAATEYFSNDKYYLRGENLILDQEKNIRFLVELVEQYPILSIEDGMAEDDWQGWHDLTLEIGNRCQLVGDDLFVTNEQRLSEGFQKRVANSILIKLNQIGTLTETIRTIEHAKSNQYSCVVSHRSGETEDTFIADLAVAMECGQIKTGSISRTDRTAKYNQLIRIEEELGNEATYYGSNLLKSFG
ncbi:MAG: phosphopyruvate hydratase [Pseudomonadota bacterium]|nr:phosphopyruvate hydratase [Pseudomonadota bacterium]